MRHFQYQISAAPAAYHEEAYQKLGEPAPSGGSSHFIDILDERGEPVGMAAVTREHAPGVAWLHSLVGLGERPFGGELRRVMHELTGELGANELRWEHAGANARGMARYRLQKGRRLHYRTERAGLPISVENRKGSIRRGPPGPDGKPSWQTKMQHPYGYFRGTEGVDGDAVDVYLGPDPDAPTAYVVHQRNPRTGRYDEDKVILGVRSAAAARALFQAHYDHPGFLGPITAIPVKQLPERLAACVGRKLSKALAKSVYPEADGGYWENTAEWSPRGGYPRQVTPEWLDWAKRGQPIQLPYAVAERRVENMSDLKRIAEALGYDPDALDYGDIRNLAPMVDQLHHLRQLHPEIKTRLSWDSTLPGSAVMAAGVNSWRKDPDEVEISYNPQHFMSERRMGETLRALRLNPGFLAVPTIRGTTSHEWGHAVDLQTTPPAFLQLRDRQVPEVSRYGGSKPQEHWAEAFAHRLHEPPPVNDRYLDTYRAVTDILANRGLAVPDQPFRKAVFRVRRADPELLKALVHGYTRKQNGKLVPVTGYDRHDKRHLAMTLAEFRQRQEGTFREEPVAAGGLSFRSLDEAERWAKAHYPWVQWDLSAASLQTAVPVLAEWRALAERWPDAAQLVREFRPRDTSEGAPSMLIMLLNAPGKPLALAYNPAFFGSPALMDEALAESRATGYCVGRTAAEILDHEFGHVVEHWLEKLGRPVAEFRKAAQTYAGTVSQYAKTYDREAWAEGICRLLVPRAEPLPEYCLRQRKFLKEKCGVSL